MKQLTQEQQDELSAAILKKLDEVTDRGIRSLLFSANGGLSKAEVVQSPSLAAYINGFITLFTKLTED